jgi:uncharacterized membrane-anchored protein
MFYIGYILGVWNGLIQFTLFLMGKFNSKIEQLESRTVSWNGLCSKFEVLLYIYIYIYIFICIISCCLPNNTNSVLFSVTEIVFHWKNFLLVRLQS